MCVFNRYIEYDLFKDLRRARNKFLYEMSNNGCFACNKRHDKAIPLACLSFFDGPYTCHMYTV